MSDAAVAFARAIGYRSAGTAEFMLDGRDFYFLELNGFIQVEYPVTELVTGVDLVEQQIRIADREVLVASSYKGSGHAVEVRLYAGDLADVPAADRAHYAAWLPRGIRVDAGVEEGDEVGLSYDPMIAKLVAHEETRPEALDRSPPRYGKRRSRASRRTSRSCAGSSPILTLGLGGRRRPSSSRTRCSRPTRRPLPHPGTEPGG